MAIDKWAQDEDYITQVKAQYAKIDKEFEEDEMSVDLPEGLTKELADNLLDEKENYTKVVYKQLALQLNNGGEQNS